MRGNAIAQDQGVPYSQLGRHGVVLTYEGWGHGSYTKSPCMKGAVDDYLVSLRLPARGDSCPAIPPTG